MTKLIQKGYGKTTFFHRHIFNDAFSLVKVYRQDCLNIKDLFFDTMLCPKGLVMELLT